MSAASQALRVAARHGEEIEVVAFERSHHTSYSACGIPYWVAGDVAEQPALVARTAEQHRRNGIDLRMRHEATALDVDGRTVEVCDVDAGTTSTMGFDEVVIATGAVPVRPDVPGADAAGVIGVQTLDDGARLLGWLDATKRRRSAPCRAGVVGAGYIGVEMAEALLRHGCEVRLVDRAQQPMTTLDPDMGALVRSAIEDLGVDVVTDASLLGFEVESDDDSRVRRVVTDRASYDAD